MELDRIICGDSAEVLHGIPDCSISAVVTDPPYALTSGENATKGFMGQTWDGQLPARAIWAEVLRVLKPGASCFVCAGARQDTILGMLTDLREVGFEIEHSALTWVFANGAMCKSLNLGKDADKAAFLAWCKEAPDGETESRAELMGWSAADLRKAASAAVNGAYSAEIADNPNVVGRKRGIHTQDGNLREWNSEAEAGRPGTGTRLLTALVSRFGPAPGVRAKVGETGRHASLPGSSSPHPMDRKNGDWLDPSLANITAPATPEAQQLDGWHGGAVPLKPMSETILWVTKPMDRKPIRANVLEHGVGGVNVERCRVPFEEGFDGWGGSTRGATRNGDGQCYNPMQELDPKQIEPQAGRYPANLLVTARALGDFSRFVDISLWAEERGLDAEWLDAALEGIVRVPKPSRAEKNRGCEGLEEKEEPWAANRWVAGGTNKGATCLPRANNHPTTKPVTLMAYLIALACPTGGTVLDPFAGSGTTLVAAKELGMRYIGVDLDESYCEIARARVAAAETPEPNLFTVAAG